MAAPLFFLHCRFLSRYACLDRQQLEPMYNSDQEADATRAHPGDIRAKRTIETCSAHRSRAMARQAEGRTGMEQTRTMLVKHGMVAAFFATLFAALMMLGANQAFAAGNDYGDAQKMTSGTTYSGTLKNMEVHSITASRRSA